MKHETEQVSIANAHERERVHADGVAILRKQLPGDRLKNGEPASQCQGDTGERDEKSAIAKHDLQKAAVVLHQRVGTEWGRSRSWR
ncbi:MAG TPA: hypothetical protein VGF88_10510 [Acidobacteriaceae bacterium]